MKIQEYDIRPEKLLNYNREILYHDDIKNFNKKFGNKFKVLKECPACGSKNFYKLFEKDTFKFQNCAKCSTLFVSPRPNNKQLSWWYTNSEQAKHANTILELTQEKRKELYKIRVDKFLQRMQDSKPKNILEFGCGNGITIELLKERDSNLNITGIDLSPSAIESCKKKGINCELSDVAAFSKKNLNIKFDTVISFEVFEHLPKPFKVLKSIYDVLTPKGTLYMTMPNFLAYDFLELGAIYRNLVVPAHLNYFNPHSIEVMLKRAGFSKVIVFSDGILDTSIVKNYSEQKKTHLSDFWEMIYSNNQYDDFLDDFQRLLCEYKLSGNMTILATK
ncbi:MAG: class I SAM-dependent methyltransferase [Arcobacteraceae bacterium]